MMAWLLQLFFDRLKLNPCGTMVKVKQPFYDWHALIAFLVVLVVILYAVWQLKPVKTMVYSEKPQESPLKPSDTPYDSGVIVY
jgi:hypothetical protein